MRADELLVIMTIKTETEKPELTYSKAKGLVELVTGIYFSFFMYLKSFSPISSPFSEFNILFFSFLLVFVLQLL